MRDVIVAGNVLLPLGYFLCAFVYARFFYRREKWSERWCGRLLFAVLVFHVLELGLRSLYLKRLPITSVFEVTAVLVWAIGTIYLYLESRLQIKSTGYFVTVFLFFLQLFASSFLSFSPSPIPKEATSPLFFLHILFGILGYSCLALSAVYSFLYLLLFYDLKKNRFTLLYERLPSLEVLGDVNLRAAQVGLLAFLISVALGAGLVMTLKKGSPIDPKILLTLLAIGVYSLEMMGYFFWNWSKRRLAVLSLLGFSLVLFSFFVVNRFLSSFHAF